MRYILHLVGDIHQPLHTVARDTIAFPNGDRGGNDFVTKTGNGLPKGATNLHRVWDSGCGAFMSVDKLGSRRGDRDVANIIAKVNQEFPLTSLKKRVQVMNVDDWSKEGLKIAQDFVYKTKEHNTPSKSYVSKGQKISRERAALAAHRLAYLLNEALSS